MYSRYLTRSPALVGVLFVGIAIVMVLVFWAKAIHLAEVTRELYPGEGTVAAIRGPVGKQGPRLDVRFQDRDGIGHISTVAISRGSWAQYRRGGPVGLLISGVDGSVAWVRSEGNPSPWDGAAPAAFTLLFLLYGVAFTTATFRKAGLRARALETGIPFPGRVISVLEGSGKSRGRWTVTYSWTVNGREHSAGSPTLRANEAGRYHADDEVPVFVDPRDERNGEVDVFGLRAGAEQLRAG